MLSTKTIGLIFSALLLSAGNADARSRWLERDGRAIFSRRFGQESPAVIQQIGSACAGQICGVLAGSAISTLLAAAPECSQQDKADEMITAAKALPDAAQTANLIALAIEFRQVEKNTPPGFNTNPVTNRNSVFCQKAPVNSELNGLVQAQDPANDPNLFFDPLDKAQVVKGDRPNTSPFGGAAVVVDPVVEEPAATATAAAEVAIQTVATPAATDVAVCPAQVTVTVTAAAAAATAVAAATTVAVAAPVITAVAGGAAGVTGKTAVVSTSTATFGTCTNAGVTFDGGLNNRAATEFTFLPTNQDDFGQQGEALNPQIIFNFICDTFVNRCGGSAANVQTCKTFATTITTRDASAAVAWNSGIENLAFSVGGAVSTVDAGGAAVAAPLTAANTPVVSTSTATFGTCTNAGVTFDGGLNNRAETEFTFLPTNQDNFGQQGEALNPQIIFNFICDTFVNRCGGNAANVASCKSFATTISTRDSSAALAWNTGIEALSF
ncbi:hypothetical protein BDY24DRAFT_417011 [Mrakia frigida]|uniref:uncharacterized protein n=1 Tax=Mrakia frigida TaxID=29902 RepID=UPI003FCC07AD